MKRIATAAFALCLLGGTSALADPDHHHDNGDHDSGQHNGGHNQGGQPHFNPQNFQHNFQGGVPQNGGQPHVNPQNFQRNFQGVPQDGGQHNDAQVFERRFRGGPQNVAPVNPPNVQNHVFAPQGFVVRPPNHNPTLAPQDRVFHDQRWNGGEDRRWQDRDRDDARGDRDRDRDHDRDRDDRERFDLHRFPHVFHSHHRFEWRGGFWFGPPGWYYQSWLYGQYLPSGWFGPQWWIEDWWDYDLPAPPYGYEWVRNGPDALLVDVDTGRIVEVVPSIFY